MEFELSNSQKAGNDSEPSVTFYERGGARARAYGLFSAADKKYVGAKRTLLRHGGRGGIRTHVGLHPTRFRVALVMTTSILFLAANIAAQPQKHGNAP